VALKLLTDPPVDLHPRKADRPVDPDDANLAALDEFVQLRPRDSEDRSPQTFINKVKVCLVESEDRYWAELSNFGNRFVNVPESAVRKYERLL